MIIKKRMNFQKKKASVLGSPMLDLILLLIILGILGYIIYNASSGGSKAVSEKLSCSGITSGILGEGECKERCTSEEQSFKNFGGCPPEKDKKLVYCCISSEKYDDGTGDRYASTGTSVYNYELTQFRLDNTVNGQCASTGSQNTHNCPGGTKVTLRVTLKNTGSKQIYLQAVAQKTILQGGYSPIVSDHLGNIGYLAKKDDTSIIDIVETIQKGKTYTFYPGARCDNTDCKNAFPPNGLQIIDYSKSITIVGQ